MTQEDIPIDSATLAAPIALPGSTRNVSSLRVDTTARDGIIAMAITPTGAIRIERAGRPVVLYVGDYVAQVSPPAPPAPAPTTAGKGGK